MGKRYTVSIKKPYWDALHEGARSTGKTMSEIVDEVMRGRAYIQTPEDAKMAEPIAVALPVAVKKPQSKRFRILRADTGKEIAGNTLIRITKQR